MLIEKILIGFVVGTLIGMTGVGGGVLLLPVLIFVLRVPPIVAVGSDALFNFVTKIGSSWVHLSKGTVRKKVVVALATGSIPGSILGVSLLGHLRTVYGTGVNTFITTTVGILLICIPTLLLFQSRIEDHVAHRSPTLQSFAGMSAIGLLAGFLVGMTSVGSGSIIMMLLLLFYSFSPKVMVGTDIVHAVILTGVTSLLHFRLGNIDPYLVGSLLIGSIPGGLLGSQLEHASSCPVVETVALCGLAGNRRSHALGLKLLQIAMTNNSNAETLQRIQSAIDAARVVFSRFTAGAIAAEYKIGHDPVTEADRALDAVLRKELLRDGEGWLSEESVDDYTRLEKSRVWVVDPLDGTREFVAGIPEFCVSIAMVENGRPIAGGICNPATNEVFLGSLESGVTYNGKPAQPSQRTTLGRRHSSGQPQRNQAWRMEAI